MNDRVFLDTNILICFYSEYDCIMLASSLENKCDIIFTVDMSDGQMIEDTLKIVNPFKDV